MEKISCIAYISQGNLFISDKNLKFKNVESRFISDLKSRLQSIQKKSEWKTSGQGAQFMGVRPAFGGEDLQLIRASFTGVTSAGESGKFIYTVHTDTMGGLFKYELESGSEQRLMHKEYFNIKDIDCNPDSGEIACTITTASGATNLFLISSSHNDITQITEGDSFDEVPVWIPGSANELVFQSAGLARNSLGHFSGIGHFSIQRLNIRTGEMDTVLENQKYDYLTPKYNSKGDLFCIKRSYDNSWLKENSPLTILQDMFLFPIRIVKAVIQYLNVFTLIYSKEPLITAGGAGKKGPDPKSIFLHGRMVDIENEMKKAGKKDNTGRIVPADWELIMIDTRGDENVIARGVSAFDICGDSVVYTNGTKIFKVQNDGKSSQIAEGRFIEKLRFVE